MTVGELRAWLGGFGEDEQVILAQDEEGNGFSPLADVLHAFYVPETPYSGDLVDQEDPQGRPACFLWPTN